MDQEHRLLNQKNLMNQKNLTKKALLVVGRMGHGKSSFLKMLTQQRNDNQQFSTTQTKTESQQDQNQTNPLSINTLNKKQPLIFAGGKNGTAECSIYQVHPSHNLLQNGQQLYAIDTPGIDSDQAACLITEQIDDILTYYSSQIVGIAYVIDISQRQQKQNGYSAFGQFFKLLKIKDKYKRKLIFSVMSKWDKIYNYKKKKTQYLKNLQEILEKQGCKQAYLERLQWSSKQNEDFEVYQSSFLLNQQGQLIIKKQWDQLRKILLKNYKDVCPFQEYKKDLKNYWQQILKQLKRLYEKENRQIAFKKQQFMFPILIDKKQIKRNYKNLIGPIFTSGALNATRFGFAFLIPSLALTGPVGISIFAGTMILGTFWTAFKIKQILSKKYKQIKQKYQQQSQENRKIKIKKQLQDKIHQKIGSLLLDQLLQKIKLQKHKMTIPYDNLYWLQDKIQAYYEKQTKYFTTADKQNPIIQYQIKQNQTRILILLKTKIIVPKLQHIDQIIKAVICKIYK